jgi:hypothetical protein
MALARAAGALEIVTPIADAVPILGSTLKAALEIATRILRYAGVSTRSVHMICFHSPIQGGEVEQGEYQGPCGEDRSLVRVVDQNIA